MEKKLKGTFWRALAKGNVEKEQGECGKMQKSEVGKTQKSKVGKA